MKNKINLDFTNKYNWWTKEEDKNLISLETKISYVMGKGTLEELVYIFKNLSLNILKKSFFLIKNDSFFLTERRKGVIQTFLEEKKLGNL